jgi:hypothetical protein
MNHNTFVEKMSTQKNLLQSLQKLENNLDQITLAISGKNQTYLQKDSYQLTAQLLTPENSWERMLYQELLQTCFQLELKCQHTSHIFLKAFISFAKEYVKKEELIYGQLVEHNQREEEKYLQKILGTCYPASYSQVSDLVDQVAEDAVVATVVKEATKLAGIEGNVVIEECDGTNVVVELQFGYNFKVFPFKGFIPQFGTWLRSNAKVLLVDGLLEKVSEMDKILMKSFETKVPLIIIAQGFSEEVIATIHANVTRGGFDIMPIRLEQTLDALNMLNDIAVVSGCDVVSTLKGEMLTYVDYDSLPVVERVSLTEKVLTLHNSKTRGNVLAHLNYLNTRRKDQSERTDVSDLADLTTKRIQNLLAHVVKVSIPKGSANRYKAPIDNAIRACRTAYTYGFCKPLEVDIKGFSKEWIVAHEYATKNMRNKPTSSIGLFLGMKYGSSLAASYFTASGAIISAA